jgi:hypothetical protein
MWLTGPLGPGWQRLAALATAGALAIALAAHHRAARSAALPAAPPAAPPPIPARLVDTGLYLADGATVDPRLLAPVPAVDRRRDQAALAPPARGRTAKPRRSLRPRKETDQPNSNWFELCVLRVFAVQLASSDLTERHCG